MAEISAIYDKKTAYAVNKNNKGEGGQAFYETGIGNYSD